MQWKQIIAAVALMCLMTTPSRAATWTSTFVGDRGLPGDASQSGDEWTVTGGGADVWDRSDAFQFLWQPVSDNASVTARIDDLQNTDPFAKSGVMVRAGLDVGAAMAILDVRPGGEIEFMTRSTSGDVVAFVAGRTSTFPVWLRLSWSQGSILAWTSHDGRNWAFVANGVVTLPASFEAGIAVTSHNPTALTVAHVNALAIASQVVPGWNSTDVGDVGLSGSASETNGVWSVSGAGEDVWGTADGFHYVYRPAVGQRRSLGVRVTDMQNTSSFAKAGLMIRTSLDPAAETVILDVRPTGDVEFMMRSTDGGEMQYIGGTTVTLPIWLRLDWTPTDNANFSSPTRVTAEVSRDGVTYTPVGPGGGVTINSLPFANQYPIPPGRTYEVGVIVSSHDANAINVAHFDGLSLFSQGTFPVGIGDTGLIGNGVSDSTMQRSPYIVEGAGADIWGSSDSFQFFGFPPQDPASVGLRIEAHVTIHASNPFAKAGVMYRDGVSANPRAPMVILDLKPDGGVEFMARTCVGCPVTYLGGVNMGGPAWLRLSHSSTTTFSAQVMSEDLARTVDLGSVTVPMNTLVEGFAVASHDPTQIAVGIFDSPPR